MALLTIHNAQLAFGDHPLLDKAEFALQENERVCLAEKTGKKSDPKDIHDHRVMCP